MSLSNDLHAIPRLLGDAVEQLGKLLQNEAQLARAELSLKLTQACTGAVYLAGAAILAIPVLVVLMIALALWVSSAFAVSAAVGYLIAGAVGAVMALALGLAGLNHFKNLSPQVTLRQVQRDIDSVKEMAR